MLHRRSTAIAAPVLGLVLAASMSACGFHYPTDRVNTIAAGENNREHSVYALGMRILSDHEGEGRLIGALSNEDSKSSATLSSIALPDGVTAPAFKPVSLAPGGQVNLATDADVELSGDITPGTVLMGVKLTVTRDGKQETIEMNIPVVKDCQQYTAVPTPSSGGSASSTSSSSSSTSSSSSSSTSSSTASSTSSSASAATSSSSPTSASAAPSSSATSEPSGAWACTWATPSQGSTE